MGGADTLQANATEAYRRSPYPPLIHSHTHPDRLATIARLAGMAPPDVATARVLELGVGDGLNTLSMAQTLPRASFIGVDIDPVAIARGNERAAKTGLANIRLEVADLLDGAAAVEGEFDYIIAHGVYAWVPPVVADGLMALIGARLSPNGVAFVSFNTLPGCYTRIPLRDAMLRACEVATDDGERLARAHQMLDLIATPRPDDGPIEAGWRAAAKNKRERDADVLIHDELGADYHPMYLRDMLAGARARGLVFLGDATHEQLGEALMTDADISPADRQGYVETRACTSDDLAFRMFRRALLIPAAAAPSRLLEPRAIEGMYAASGARESDDEVFASGVSQIRCTHPVMVATLRRLIAASPARIPVAELALDDVCLKGLVELFDEAVVDLYTVGTPSATAPPDPPIVSPVARVMIAEGADRVPNLDHRVAALDPGAARAATMLDGLLTLAEARAWMTAEGIDPDIVFAGLTGQGLLLPS